MIILFLTLRIGGIKLVSLVQVKFVDKIQPIESIGSIGSIGSRLRDRIYVVVEAVDFNIQLLYTLNLWN
jgi:hypothetical protein